MLSWIALFLLAFSEMSFAACKEVRLDKKGGPFEKIPVYNQAQFTTYDPGICYAIAASQIIDADRFYKGDSLQKLSSPLAIAAKTKKQQPVSFDTEKNGSPFVLGFDKTTLALNSAKNSQVCDQNYFERFASIIDRKERNPVAKKLYAGPPKNSFTSTTGFLASLLKQRKELAKINKDLNKFSPQIAPALCENQYIETRLGITDNVEDVRKTIQAAVNEYSFEKQIDTTIDSLCQNNQIKIGELKINSSFGYTNQSLAEIDSIKKDNSLSQLQKIQDILKIEAETSAHRGKNMLKSVTSLLESDNPVPVAIGYDVSAIVNSKSFSHASVLIGQRPASDGSCEYLLRDSYGANCSESVMKYKYPCENGSVWVPQKELEKSVQEIQWIER